MENKESVHPLKEGKVLLIDKPYTWTSFDAVKKVKIWAQNVCGDKKIKVGHAGTLDPLATGLLIVCIGKETRNIEKYQGWDKEYTGTFVLGSTTKSYDLEKEVEKVVDELTVDEIQLKEVVARLSGEIRQVPPTFSAVKVDGKRAYEYARKDKEVNIEPKTVFIREFEITRIAWPEVDFRIVCSKGTYIRSIARDLGDLLGCGAYLSALRRTKIGTYQVDQAVSPLQLSESYDRSGGFVSE